MAELLGGLSLSGTVYRNINTLQTLTMDSYFLKLGHH